MTDRGFTLLEVLVALAIVALGMMAVFTQAGQSTFATVLMQEKTLASWVAMNRLSELSVAPLWPEIGETGGEVEFADRYWRWRQTVSSTPSPVLRRVDVTVSLAVRPEQGLYTASAFLAEPQPPQLDFPWARAVPDDQQAEALQ